METDVVVGVDGQGVVAVGRAAVPGVEEPGAAAQQFVVSHSQCSMEACRPHGTQCCCWHSRAG